jgi:AcrR family transcriptional regulator
MTEKEKLTEERIFDAATEIFLERGMDGARMQEIADLAGINKSLLHYYYRSKDRLFDAVFEKVANRMFARFSPLLDPGLTLEEKIRFFFREHIGFLEKNPRLPSFLLNEINRNPERMKKIIRKFNIGKIYEILEQQHGEEFRQIGITPSLMPQIMTSVAAMSIFPFAARGIVETILEKIGIRFNDYIEARKTFAADFVIRAFRQGDLLPPDKVLPMR